MFFRPTILLLLSLLALSACQSKVYLMPPPVALQPDGDFFRMTPENKDGNLLYTLYATNRTPENEQKNNPSYTINPSDTLRLGWVAYQVGDDDTSWDDLYRQSIKHSRDKELLLSLKYTREITQFGRNEDPNTLSAQAEGLFQRINQLISRSWDKDLTIYVHGANSNFYRATAQGAMLFHYTGHNSLVLTFAWPSAARLLRYKTDVKNARASIPAFTQLIERIARYTKVEKINILAYSAGAQVVAPGLAHLRTMYADTDSATLKKRFRIGEVYFAAPDTAFKLFVDRFLTFKDIVDRTTVNLNHSDKILRLAHFSTGMSRLGRPDLSEITKKKQQVIINTLKTGDLHVVDLGASSPLKIGRAHDSWYNHPWVSNDLFVLLLLKFQPEERGLIAKRYPGGAVSYQFPPDYDTLITKLLVEWRDTINEKRAMQEKQQNERNKQ